MSEVRGAFQKPSAAEQVFNRIFGFLVGLGFGTKHNYLLQVRGRKSGKIYSTPVNVLDRAGRRYLVAPRGETQWVRNARASLQVTLKKGGRRESFDLKVIPDQEKPAILKAYLDSFSTTVRRYFPVQAGSGPEAFASLSARYPVFEMLPSARPF
jgi:deazaflavin-dependent oxidoreductase (nitroreductase family)